MKWLKRKTRSWMSMMKTKPNRKLHQNGRAFDEYLFNI